VGEPADPRHTVFCSTHPALFASLACHRCGAPICHHCMVRAEGQALCDRDLHKRRATATRTRTRQLFAVFLFTVFLYQVGSWFREDQNRVSPYGPVPMVVAQFVDADPGPDPWIVKALNGEPVRGYAGPSLKELGAWFDAEHRRYTKSEFPYAQITVRGPWHAHVDPPELGRNSPWWRIGFASLFYARYFHNLALDHGIDTREFGVRAYVVFKGGDEDLASHSRGSEKGRLAVAYVALEEANPAYALASVAHEICHALGARDLYEPTMLPSYPEGFVEPFQKPLYPQRFAEIMAVDLPVGRGEENEIQSLDQLRIGYRTAADLGWIGEEEADRFYTPREVQPEELLDGEPLP
jgi:hypothetical protein